MEALARLPRHAPSFLNFASGRGRYTLPVPLGARARLDADERTLTMLEPGVEK